MEKNMETNIVYWGHLGRMEEKMEATIVCQGYMGKIGKITDKTLEHCPNGRLGFRV